VAADASHVMPRKRHIPIRVSRSLSRTASRGSNMYQEELEFSSPSILYLVLSILTYVRNLAVKKKADRTVSPHCLSDLRFQFVATGGG
jgi:hypothetical protein